MCEEMWGSLPVHDSEGDENEVGDDVADCLFVTKAMFGLLSNRLLSYRLLSYWLFSYRLFSYWLLSYWLLSYWLFPNWFIPLIVFSSHCDSLLDFMIGLADDAWDDVQMPDSGCDDLLMVSVVGEKALTVPFWWLLFFSGWSLFASAKSIGFGSHRVFLLVSLSIFLYRDSLGVKDENHFFNFLNMR